MFLSKLFIPITKDLPAEAKIKSHQLMLRTGMIKQSSAGIYSWLPLGFKVIKKNRANSQRRTKFYWSSRNVNANYPIIRNLERKRKV